MVKVNGVPDDRELVPVSVPQRRRGGSGGFFRSIATHLSKYTLNKQAQLRNKRCRRRSGVASVKK
jgi:hypothetical protein